MNEFVLKQQLPDAETAKLRAEVSLTASTSSSACPCPHLLAVLPQQLDLSLRKSKQGWILANPVHSLHLQSQLDPTSLADEEEEPVLYGDEQERLMAFLTEGFPETWHPWIHESTDVDLLKSAVSTAPVNVTTAAAGAPPTTTSSSNSPNKLPTPVSRQPSSQPPLLLPENRYWSIFAGEDQIRILRRALLSKRSVPAATKTPLTTKKRRMDSPKSHLHLAAWRRPAHATHAGQPVVQLSDEELAEWYDQQASARQRPNQWLEHYRRARQAYWRSLTQQGGRQSVHVDDRGRRLLDGDFGAMDTAPESDALACRECRSPDWSGDDLMQCLECNFIGCAPSTMSPGSPEHMVAHLVASNHGFAVTCGPRARIYCVQCGETVSHEIFAQERFRLDTTQAAPWMGWKEHCVQRSFDALRFMRVVDQGIVWRGMGATYPALVPDEHWRAAGQLQWRRNLFLGNVEDLPEGASPAAIGFAMSQSKKAKEDIFSLAAPIGIYNLGNSCFISAVLQCLVHCTPVKKYFLHDMGHHHLSCPGYRSVKSKGSPKKAPPTSTIDAPLHKTKEVCLACELDKIILRCFGSAAGTHVLSLVGERHESPADANPRLSAALDRGEPLVVNDMLVAVWNCKELSHLHGYAQRDAHEFLHGFLEILGKHTRRYRERVHQSLNLPRPSNAIVSDFPAVDQDIIKRLFEGQLRSVLVCGKCGSKRMQHEQFMSLSLPLSKEVQKATAEIPGESSSVSQHVKISVERCLRHFTMPEALADPVDCPSCKEKTPTTKQHVVSKLPRVLCLHLKRFDAAQNRKIEDFVSFPARSLNMGPYLPHWCEVTRTGNGDGTSTAVDTPSILYDLFGTVNHFGNLQSGHYVANVKVDEHWYHCNDAHVSNAGLGTGEEEVVKSDGAYLLFYIRSDR